MHSRKFFSSYTRLFIRGRYIVVICNGKLDRDIQRTVRKGTNGMDPRKAEDCSLYYRV